MSEPAPADACAAARAGTSGTMDEPLSPEAEAAQEAFRALAGGPELSLAQRRAASADWSRLGIPRDDVTTFPVDVGGVPGEWVEARGGVSADGTSADGASAGAAHAAADRVSAGAAGFDAPVLLYLHGGAYTLGSPATHRHLAGHLAAALDCRVLSLDYRLAPEHPFPAALDDAATALSWLADTAGIDPRRTLLGGDSAGGGIALGTLVKLRDEGRPVPAGAFALSPTTDLTLSGASFQTRAADDPLYGAGRPAGYAARYLGAAYAQFLAGADPADPWASPLHADLAGLPPLLLHVGEREVLADDAVRLAARAEAAGVATTLTVWPRLHHAFQLGAGRLPEADRAIAAIAAWAAPLLAPERR